MADGVRTTTLEAQVLFGGNTSNTSIRTTSLETQVLMSNDTKRCVVIVAC